MEKRNPMLKKAFEEAAKKELSALPEERCVIRPYSPQFEEKMERLIEGNGDNVKEKPFKVKKRKVRWAVLVAAVLMVVVFSTGAVAGNSILSWFSFTPDPENYATIDFEVDNSYQTGKGKTEMSEIVYEGEKITFKYIVDTGASFDWPDRGLLVYLDGVRQTFDAKTTEGEYNNIEMLNFANEKGTVKTVEFTVEPNIGQKGDELFLSVMEIYDPNLTYYPQCDTENKELFVGHSDGDNDRICDDCGINIDEAPSGPSSYTSMSTVIARVVMGKDAPVQTKTVSSYSGLKVDELEKIIYKSYNSEDSFGKKRNDYDTIETLDIDLYKDIDDCYFYELGAICSTRRIETQAKQEDDFTINLHGKTGKYRVSVYINHELQNIFDGDAYADVDVVHGQQTELDIKLDTSVLAKGDNYCYILYEELDDAIDDFIGTTSSDVFTIEVK